MKSLKKLSLLALTLALMGGVAALPAYADDAMMKKDDSSMAMQKDDGMKKDDSMKKDAMTKGSDHMQKNDSMVMTPNAMTKDGKDKMAPDAAMMNK